MQTTVLRIGQLRQTHSDRSSMITDIDATQSPVDVLGKIVSVLVEDRRNHFGEEGFSAVT